VGFDLFVQWFNHGTSAYLPLEAVREAFGPAAGPIESRGFSVSYGPGEQSFVYVTPTPGNLVTHVMIQRPCAVLSFWDALVTLLRLGNGFAYWPGTATAIAHAGVISHLPDDFTDAPHPTVVNDGAHFIQLIESS
jgi:hypothetical protein